MFPQVIGALAIVNYFSARLREVSERLDRIETRLAAADIWAETERDIDASFRTCVLNSLEELKKD